VTTESRESDARSRQPSVLMWAIMLVSYVGGIVVAMLAIGAYVDLQNTRTLALFVTDILLWLVAIFCTVRACIE
jgi:hypothetical protein